jgi:hypothetical protein
MPEFNIIFYGTLRDPDILRLVGGHPLTDKYWQTIDWPNYQAVYVAGALFPAAVAAPGQSMPVDLFCGLSERERQAIVDYEDDDYEVHYWQYADRQFAIFMPRPTLALTATTWDLRDFQNRYKTRYCQLMSNWLK